MKADKKLMIFDFMKQLTFILFLCGASVSFGQNYIEYQRTFNRIDEDILAGDYASAIERLDSINSGFEFIFARHCIKALQICVTANDSLKADIWLTKCFKQGVPIWLVNTNELTKKSLQYTTTQNTILKLDNLYSVYETSINLKLSKFIDSLFTIDQKYTRKVNDGFFLFRHTVYGLQWLRNNKRQFEIIDTIIDRYGFPGERLIGLGEWEEDSASVKLIKHYGPVFIDDKRVYFMLIHYFSSPRKDINDKLLRSVINGFIPAYQFGALNDFMAQWGRHKYGDYQFFNVWHKDTNPENLDKINECRLSIGLNTYEQQERNKLIEKERLKNKTANSEIILE